MRLVSNFQILFRSSKRDERINKIGDEAPATAISATVNIPRDGGAFGFLHEGAVGEARNRPIVRCRGGADIRRLTGNASVSRGAANQRARPAALGIISYTVARAPLRHRPDG